MSNDNGGKAFPLPPNASQQGMNLLDYFAATALPSCIQGALDGMLEDDPDEVAKAAYGFAISMVEARRNL